MCERRNVYWNRIIWFYLWVLSNWSFRSTVKLTVKRWKMCSKEQLNGQNLKLQRNVHRTKVYIFIWIEYTTLKKIFLESIIARPLTKYFLKIYNVRKCFCWHWRIQEGGAPDTPFAHFFAKSIFRFPTFPDWQNSMIFPGFLLNFQVFKNYF